MAYNFTMEWAPKAMTSFAENAKKFLQENGPDSLPALQQEFSDLFSNRVVLTELSNRYLQHVATGNHQGGDATVAADAFVISYSPDMTLRIIKDRTDAQSFSAKENTDILCSYAANTLILFLSRAATEVKWFALDEGANFDRFDSSLKIVRQDTELIPPGGVVFVEGRKRFPNWNFQKGDLYVVLSTRAVNAQLVSFTTDTLKPLGASMSSENNSILCVMLEQLHAQQADYPLKGVLELTEHDDHHVRWAAITALGKHDGTKALTAVTKALNDMHPFIRNAAQRTLHSVEGIKQ